MNGLPYHFTDKQVSPWGGPWLIENMKNILILIVLVGLFSCSKDTVAYYKRDERDSVTGNYSGIDIYSHWNQGYTKFVHDTTSIVLNLKRSDQDSIVLLYYGDCYYAFKYHNYRFISILDYHPPSLKYRNDSIFVHDQPMLGPVYWDDACKRIK
jgi:hypothetical protein